MYLPLTSKPNDYSKKETILRRQVYISRSGNRAVRLLLKLFPLAEASKRMTLFTAISTYGYKSTRKSKLSVKVTQFEVSIIKRRLAYTNRRAYVWQVRLTPFSETLHIMHQRARRRHPLLRCNSKHVRGLHRRLLARERRINDDIPLLCFTLGQRLWPASFYRDKNSLSSVDRSLPSTSPGYRCRSVIRQHDDVRYFYEITGKASSCSNY